MAIRFQLQDGSTGTLDVAKLVAEQRGGDITGVKNGIVMFTKQDGSQGGFSIGQWAEENQAEIVSMDGFNGPDSAIEAPPNGMNYMDQTAFFYDGQDMEALSELFPKNLQRDDGRVVVLDNDGLWKTMWSPYIHSPMEPLSEEDKIRGNLVQDPNLVLRAAGINFLFGLCGMSPTTDNEHNFKIEEIIKVLEIIGRNAPFEIKTQIATIMEQTTGLSPFKFINALLAPREVGAALLQAKKRQQTSFEYRMMQLDMAEVIMEAMKLDVRNKFMETVTPLAKLDETSKLLVNLKQIAEEFIQHMVGLDLLRDISKTTGLNEWIALNEDSAYDPTRLPDMPEFVEQFVMLLRYLMPIVQKSSLSMARGKTGLKALVNLDVMIDDCIFSLAGVPDHSAKYKMMMALKRLQSQIETKLAFVYHPNVDKNKAGLRENPFMQAKEMFGPIRDALYRTIQQPKESWAQVMLQELSSQENVERFYDTLPKNLAKLWQGFAALDAAYDMQPWVDVEYKHRTHDSFSEFHPTFGERPPEAGYLSKNSSRAIYNISETLIIGGAMLQAMDEKQSRQLLRNPFHFTLFLKGMMAASVNRELGVVEVLNKIGISPMDDSQSLPDANRMWEDPQKVAHENRRQVEELMGSLAMQSMAQPQQPTPQGEMVEDTEFPDGQQPKAGPGPMGPPQRASVARKYG